MKESGIEWIGLIPCEWGTIRMQDIAEYKKGPFGSAITIDMFVDKGENTYKVYEQKNAIQADETLGWYYIEKNDYLNLKEFSLRPGDIIVSCAGTIGKCFVLPENIEEGIINQASMRVRTYSNIDKSFFIYLFTVALEYMNEKFSNGSAIKNIPPFSVLKKQKIAVPCKTEQKIIANFLDERCMKIDDAIADLEKQLKILTDYKTALINECVTRGCSEIKLKDSGIKCIGKINSRWDVKRLKYLLATPLQYGANEAGDDYDERNPRYIRITDISENNFLKDDGKQSLEYSLAKPYLLNNGDVLFARSGATVGKTFYYTKDCGVAAFAGYLIRATTKSSILYSKFLYYITLSSYYESWKNTSFSMATIQNIGADKYNDLPIVLPKLKEQIKIVDYLDEKVTLINEIINKKQLQLEKIKSNKSSLIYEYVTGKKRVKVGE